jgi:hypothetical protein
MERDIMRQLLIWKEKDGRKPLLLTGVRQCGKTYVCKEFGKKHSLEYISSLWRNKIPQLIAEKAAEFLLDWHYLQVEKGKYKKCNRCGQIKLAHSKYFSKNKTSKDGWYSICKNCRSKKGAKQ